SRQFRFEALNGRHRFAEERTQLRLLQVARQESETIAWGGQVRRDGDGKCRQVTPALGRSDFPLTGGTLPVDQIDCFRLRIDQDVVDVEIPMRKAGRVKASQHLAEPAGKLAAPANRGIDAGLEEMAEFETTGQLADEQEGPSARQFARGDPLRATGEMQ